MSRLLDDRGRPVEYTPEIAIPLSGQCCCTAPSSRKLALSLGLWGLRDVHEVYHTIHVASVLHLASHDVLRVYASDWRFIIEADYFKSTFGVGILVSFFGQTRTERVKWS